MGAEGGGGGEDWREAPTRLPSEVTDYWRGADSGTRLQFPASLRMVQQGLRLSLFRRYRIPITVTRSGKSFVPLRWNVSTRPFL